MLETSRMGNLWSSYEKQDEIYNFGWIRDTPDIRDEYHSFSGTPQKSTHDLLGILGQFPIYDQGKLGFCTGTGLACVFQYDEIKQNLSDKTIPSRLFIYYNEREIERTVSTDSGAQIRDGITPSEI